MKLGSEARTPRDITPITLPRPRLIMPHCRVRKLLFVSATVEMQIARSLAVTRVESWMNFYWKINHVGLRLSCAHSKRG
jgi:hypothetical protein